MLPFPDGVTLILLFLACRRINAVECLAIVQYWFTATNAADAPVLQLKLYRDLLALRRHYQGPVDAVLNRLQTHLYFVSEEMTPLALASPLLDDGERSALAKVLMAEVLILFSFFS